MPRKASYEEKPIEVIKSNLRFLFRSLPEESFENYELEYRNDDEDTNALFSGGQFLILFDRENKNNDKRQILMRSVDVRYAINEDKDVEGLTLTNQEHEELKADLDKICKDVGVDMSNFTADTDDYLSLINFLEEIIIHLKVTPRSGQLTLKTSLINSRNFLCLYYTFLRYDPKNRYYLDVILQILAFVTHPHLSVDRLREMRHLLEPAIDEICAKFDICFEMMPQGSWIPGLVVGFSLMIGYTMATAEPLIGVAVGLTIGTILHQVCNSVYKGKGQKGKRKLLCFPDTEKIFVVRPAEKKQSDKKER